MFRSQIDYCVLRDSRLGVYGLRGKSWLDIRLRAYNAAARHSRWLVLRDLNSDGACAPELRERLVPELSDGMRFRIAVREAESWLLADRRQMGQFLAIAVSRIPSEPDTLGDPKQTLVNLARHSRRRAIREDMVPAAGTSAHVGPGYTARIIEFANDIWDPIEAAAHSPSLSSCIASLRDWTA